MSLLDTNEEYADAVTHEARATDATGRVLPELLTDRELMMETVCLLRGLSDGMGQLMQQVGPSIDALQNGPLGRFFGR